MRLAAQQKGGFYAAHPEAVRHVAKYLNMPASGPAGIFLLDPCAGRGEAVEVMATCLGLPPEQVYAIELEEDRSQDVHGREAIGNVLAPCSTFGCSVQKESLSLLWLNPPFDDAIGGGARVESQFLFSTIKWLAPGGVLCLVCPADVVGNDGLKRLLMAWCDRISIVPFPEDHRPFNEVCVMAYRRPDPVDPRDLMWLRCRETTPIQYDIPALKSGPKVFAKTALTEPELLRAIESSPLTQLLTKAPAPPMSRPPMELGVGHLALLLASGHLDGLVEPDGEPPHVVRGVARKREYLKDTEIDEDKVTMIYSEKIEMLVRMVDVTGSIKTLGGEADKPAIAAAS